jgi:hypothetical protein
MCEEWDVLTRARQKHIPFLFDFDKPFVVVYPLDSHEVSILLNLKHDIQHIKRLSPPKGKNA